jgi:hypothetical protein
MLVKIWHNQILYMKPTQIYVTCIVLFLLAFTKAPEKKKSSSENQNTNDLKIFPASRSIYGIIRTTQQQKLKQQRSEQSQQYGGVTQMRFACHLIKVKIYTLWPVCGNRGTTHYTYTAGHDRGNSILCWCIVFILWMPVQYTDVNV